MKTLIFEEDASALLMSGYTADLVILDPPYELWDEHKKEWLTGAWNAASKDSYLVCFCNPTSPDDKGKRRLDFIIESAVEMGFRFKYELIWIRGQNSTKHKHPSNRNTRILVFSKGSPKLNKFCMEHTNTSLKTTVLKERRSAGGTVLKAGIYTPNPEGRTLTDVLDQYQEEFIEIDLDAHEGSLTFYENMPKNINIGGNGALERKRIQSKPAGLMKTLMKAFSSPGQTIMDPFAGSGTTMNVAEELERNCILSDIDPTCIKFIKSNLKEGGLIISHEVVLDQKVQNQLSQVTSGLQSQVLTVPVR